MCIATWNDNWWFSKLFIYQYDVRDMINRKMDSQIIIWESWICNDQISQLITWQTFYWILYLEMMGNENRLVWKEKQAITFT